jgi:hypothetical protein
MNAILRVYDVARGPTFFDPLVHPCRTIARGRTAVTVVLGCLLQCRIAYLEVWRLVFLVVGIGKEDGREPIKS